MDAVQKVYFFNENPKRLIFLLVFLFSTRLCSNAQSPLIASLLMQKDSIVTNKVVTYQNRFIARYVVADKNLRLHFREGRSLNKIIEYEPTNIGFVGFGGTYGSIGVELLIRVRNHLKAHDEKYGYTAAFDMQTNSYGKKYGFDIIVQRYKGFYIRNPEKYDSTWSPATNYPQRPDLIAKNVAGNFYYIFNDKNFSFRSSFNQKDRQVKSAGSLILMSSLFLVSQKGDSSIIPKNSKPEFNNTSLIKEATYMGLALMPGYGHTFVANKFYITLSLFIGGALQHQSYEIDNKKNNKISGGLKSNIRTGMGYNSDKFFSGISFVADNSHMRIHTLVITTKSNNFRIFTGVRF